MHKPLQPLLSDLKKDNSLKAWSLIITFFGDSVAPRGGVVSAATIQSVMELCGIGSGTVRTALSRLGKDDWVSREKSGRNSFYRLSEKGTAQSSLASAAIYSPPAQKNTQTEPLYLILNSPQHVIEPDKTTLHIQLNNNTSLVQANRTQLAALRKQHMVKAQVTELPLPDWIQTYLIPELLAEKYRLLTRRLEQLPLKCITQQSDAIALRTILIHEWRRLRLRPDQHTVNPAVCKTVQHEAHEKVAEIYQQISPLADTWLKNHASGPEGELSISKVAIKKRFR